MALDLLSNSYRARVECMTCRSIQIEFAESAVRECVQQQAADHIVDTTVLRILCQKN